MALGAMSFETKCFFEIGDILALCFHCKKCGAGNVRPVRTLSGDWGALVTNPCPNCHTPSGIQPNTQEGTAFLSFIEALVKMTGAVNGRNLVLRLEVACPPDAR